MVVLIGQLADQRIEIIRMLAQVKLPRKKLYLVHRVYMRIWIQSIVVDPLASITRGFELRRMTLHLGP